MCFLVFFVSFGFWKKSDRFFLRAREEGKKIVDDSALAEYRFLFFVFSIPSVIQPNGPSVRLSYSSIVIALVGLVCS